MLKAERTGHVVLNVRDVEVSTNFYVDVLGFVKTLEIPGRGTFLSCGTMHHDLAVFKAEEDAGPVTHSDLGMQHVAFQVESYEMLTKFYHRLKELGLVERTVDHTITKSVYFSDPDGIRLELYCNSFEDDVEGLAMIGSDQRVDKELIIS